MNSEHHHVSQDVYPDADGRRISRFFPSQNIPKSLEPLNEGPHDLPPQGSFFYFKKRNLEMVVGGPDDLELEEHPSYGRVRDGFDTGWMFRGLRKMLFIPSLRAYIVDDHHYFYYTLWEAQKLGLYSGSPWLYHFDMHHDFAQLKVAPPPESDLRIQSRYLIDHLRIGNHITAALAAKLVRGVTWITTPEELEYKSSDMHTDTSHFQTVAWQDFHAKAVQPGAIISLDWDFLSAMFSGGQPLSPVSQKEVDWFTGWWVANNLHRDYAMLCIATSPGYCEETSLIPGVRRFLRSLGNVHALH